MAGAGRPVRRSAAAGGVHVFRRGRAPSSATGAEPWDPRLALGRVDYVERMRTEYPPLTVPHLTLDAMDPLDLNLHKVLSED